MCIHNDTEYVWSNLYILLMNQIFSILCTIYVQYLQGWKEFQTYQIYSVMLTIIFCYLIFWIFYFNTHGDSFQIPATHLYKQIAHWNILSLSIYFYNFCIIWLLDIIPLFSVLHFTPACLLRECILWSKPIVTNSSIFENKWENVTKLRTSTVKLHL